LPLPDVVFTVSAAVTAPLPVIVTDAGTVHVGGVVALGVTLQDMLTVPVKPPDGVTVITEVFPVVAPRVTLMLPPLLRVKLGTGA
jgi:hypothetical protein